MRLLADAALATVRAALDPALFAEAFSGGTAAIARGGVRHDFGVKLRHGRASAIGPTISLTVRNRLGLPHVDTATSSPLLRSTVRHPNDLGLRHRPGVGDRQGAAQLIGRGVVAHECGLGRPRAAADVRLVVRISSV